MSAMQKVLRWGRDDLALSAAAILLDRAHVSPGEIDGLDGDNFHNAVRAFQQVNRLRCCFTVSPTPIRCGCGRRS
jgi:hypothetical protein